MRYQRQLPVFTAVAALALICGCVYPSYEGDEFTLEEQQSVWQYLKVYSIYNGRLPNFAGSMTPYDMFRAINDSLGGGRYTEYVDDRPGGGAMFDPNTKFHDPQPLTADSSTMYFRLPEFSDTALEYFIINMRELSRYPNLIIDVRKNGGGLLSVTDSILGELLPYDTPYIKNRYRRYNNREYVGETTEDTSRTTTRNPHLLNRDGRPKRIAVLMNDRSASASEILAAGLKDAAGAYLIGGKSYGKGIGQVIINRDGRKRISITFLEIRGLTERTGLYHRVGIEPDDVPPAVKGEALARWPDAGSQYVRELYYALKMLEPKVTLNPEEGGDALAAKLRDVTAAVYGAGSAKAVWRPMGAVVVDERDLPIKNIKSKSLKSLNL
jgi:hypothetical protein